MVSHFLGKDFNYSPLWLCFEGPLPSQGHSKTRGRAKCEELGLGLSVLFLVPLFMSFSHSVVMRGCFTYVLLWCVFALSCSYWPFFFFAYFLAFDQFNLFAFQTLSPLFQLSLENVSTQSLLQPLFRISRSVPYTLLCQAVYKNSIPTFCHFPSLIDDHIDVIERKVPHTI